MTVYDDEWPDQIEDDPRWEVQPVPVHDDDAGGHAHRVFVVLVAGIAIAALLVWLMPGSPLGF